MVKQVTVIGAGPAGSAAALAALAEGASVRLHEKSRFPRHKVCGEFLSPELITVFESLQVQEKFLAARPARLKRAVLRIGNREKRFALPEPAFSLSRYALDHLLLEETLRRGASLTTATSGEPLVIAHGRKAAAPKGGRLFGFKAHFRGSLGDAVEMFFFQGGYAGVSPVEDGFVNVCGLAPEEMLSPHGFQPEAIFPQALRDRLRPLDQSFAWLVTGPLIFQHKLDGQTESYLAGDALGFIDPFTGSGILSAILTGRLAGQSAARGVSIADYTVECRRILGRPYSAAALARRALGTGVVSEILLNLARWIPGPLLYRLTRPAPAR